MEIKEKKRFVCLYINQLLVNVVMWSKTNYLVMSLKILNKNYSNKSALISIPHKHVWSLWIENLATVCTSFNRSEWDHFAVIRRVTAGDAVGILSMAIIEVLICVTHLWAELSRNICGISSSTVFSRITSESYM